MVATTTPTMNKALQDEIKKELEVFQKLQKDLQKMMLTRQRLDVQLNENKIVREELGHVDSTSKVFKLIGPVLVAQELPEAHMNVDKRIEYIDGELKRYDVSLKDLETKQNASKEKLAQLQQVAQAASRPPR